MSESTQPRAGWYLDPQQPELQRYWDGTQWTDRTALAPGVTPPTVEATPQVPQAQQAAPPSTAADAGTAGLGSSPSLEQAPAPAQPPAPAPAQVAPAPTAPIASDQPAAAEPEKSPRRIGRGTIVFIFIAAVVAAIGGSILLSGGLPT